jgi:hypothetical protein
MMSSRRSRFDDEAVCKGRAEAEPSYLRSLLGGDPYVRFHERAKVSALGKPQRSATAATLKPLFNKPCANHKRAVAIASLGGTP